MKIASIFENLHIEKRVAITPETAKKYISLGFEVLLPNGFASHLGFSNDEYSKLGVKILDDEKEILANANILVQLGLLSEEKFLLMKEKQTLVGVLNPYENKEKLDTILWI